MNELESLLEQQPIQHNNAKVTFHTGNVEAIKHIDTNLNIDVNIFTLEHELILHTFTGIKELVENNISPIIASNRDSMINAARLFKKAFPTVDVEFIYHKDNGETEHINCLPDGQVSHYPESFNDSWDATLFLLLRK